MDRPSDTSLDRFLNSRGASMVYRGGRGASRIQIAVGAGSGIVGLGLGAAGLATGIAGLIFGSLGPLLAGAINVVVGMAMKARTDRGIDPNVRLSPEARSFLIKLLRRRLGWRYDWTFNDSARDGLGIPTPTPTIAMKSESPPLPRFRAGIVVSPHWSPDRSTATMLAPAAFDLLEAGAHEYNRTIGALAAARESGQATLQKMHASISAAMDESMAILFHQAALLEKYPESASGTSKEAQAQLVSMKEVADRVDHIRAREQTLTDRLDSGTRLQSVLDDLRMDQLARSELEPQNRDPETFVRE